MTPHLEILNNQIFKYVKQVAITILVKNYNFINNFYCFYNFGIKIKL